ncbi:MAG TPA: hypothetical protein VFR18_14690 [Terriglobia bacterium]|nr:hypothetical protein [Terriglobia bacterium]
MELSDSRSYLIICVPLSVTKQTLAVIGVELMTTVAMSGKATDLELLFLEHYRFVYRTAYGIIGNPEDAQSDANEWIETLHHASTRQGRCRLVSNGSRFGESRALRRRLLGSEAAQFPVKLSRTKEIANGQTHCTRTILNSYDATNALETTQFSFSNILALDEYLAHRALDIQTGLINPGLAAKAPRSEVQVASNMKHDFVSLGHNADRNIGTANARKIGDVLCHVRD